MSSRSSRARPSSTRSRVWFRPRLTLTVDLEAGDYTFACKLNGHDQAGMTGTLTVA